jgi:hypothetical protein
MMEHCLCGRQGQMSQGGAVDKGLSVFQSVDLTMNLACGRNGANSSQQAFPTPALRKHREGRGTHSVSDSRKIKNLGHPPLSKGRESEMSAPSAFDQVSTTKSNSTPASPPTLAKNARMGHPQREWCTQRSLKMGYPPVIAVRGRGRPRHISLRVGP